MSSGAIRVSSGVIRVLSGVNPVGSGAIRELPSLRLISLEPCDLIKGAVLELPSLSLILLEPCNFIKGAIRELPSLSLISLEPCDFIKGAVQELPSLSLISLKTKRDVITLKCDVSSGNVVLLEMVASRGTGKGDSQDDLRPYVLFRIEFPTS